jgi:hypothetical protein
MMHVRDEALAKLREFSAALEGLAQCLRAQRGLPHGPVVVERHDDGSASYSATTALPQETEHAS